MGSLNTTLGLIGLGTVVLLMSALMVASYLNEKRSIQTELHESAEGLSTRLSLSLARPLWNFEYQTIQLALQVEARSADLAWIVVRDENQIIQVGIFRSAEGHLVSDTGAIRDLLSHATAFDSHVDKLLYQGKTIGTIEVAVSDAARESQFLNRMGSLILAQLAISFGTMLVIILCVRLLIIKRLSRLQRLVSGFGMNDFSKRSQETSRDEIGELARQFNLMADTIHRYSTDLEGQVRDRTSQLVESEKLAFLGSLVAGIAHEINTPVGVCLTAITYLESRIAEVRRQYLSGELSKIGFNAFMDELERSSRLVVSNLNRTSELVRTFRGIGADQLTDDCRLFDLGGYLHEIVFSLSPKLRKSGHEVAIHCPAPITITSYPSAFYQIVSNLIVNSLTHAFPDGRKGHIDIGVHKEDGLALIHYRDDGVGIPSEAVPKIFNPFFTTKRGQGGTGLGLYIVYSLVSKMEGTVVCQSQPGEGVEFIIKIPLASPVPPA